MLSALRHASRNSSPPEAKPDVSAAFSQAVLDYVNDTAAAATRVMDGFRKMARRSKEIEIAFGVTLDGKLGGIIASANAGAHLDVTLRWRGRDAALDDAERP